jgi:hypothetical protein
MDMSVRHYVTFYSPGTFVSETTIIQIDSWDVNKAIELSKTIKERHGAIPYGFSFKTVKSDGFEKIPVNKSGMYYLGGKILSYDDIEDIPENKILRSNMRNNNYKYVIENTNSWKVVLPFDFLNDTCIPYDVNNETH